MLDNVLRRLSEVERRLSNIFLIGTIADADYDNALVKVEAGSLETGWLHWITARAGNDVDYWAPEVGEQVAVMCPGGEPELGVVLPALYQKNASATDKRPTVRRIRFADGADFSYDRELNTLKIMLPNGATTELLSKGGVDIVGDLHVSGKVTATKAISDGMRSMQDDRDIYNKHTHIPTQNGIPTSDPEGKQ